jgi:hypothetical protein
VSGPAGLDCPECGELAALVIHPDMAFCGNESCRILKWDMAKTLEQIMAEGITEVDLRGF